MMRKVIVQPDGVRVVDAETPVPGPGEAQLEMLVAGVCGSDTHALRGRHPHVRPPYAPGHEVVGVVTAVAPDVTTVRVVSASSAAARRRVAWRARSRSTPAACTSCRTTSTTRRRR